MANLLDYLAWRGDLPFRMIPFCEVDCLILCRLSYIPFDGIVPAAPDGAPVPLALAAGEALRLAGEQGDGRYFRLQEDAGLLALLRESTRFSGAGLSYYVNQFDASRQEQFSAITIRLPDRTEFLSFRGTDGTLVGWKEDFNLGYCDVIPAQLDAAKYLETAAGILSGPLRVGGHSKGGNLAVYASAFCRKELQNRIVSVRNMDGPGFNEKVIASEGYKSIMARTRTFLPQSSVFGMLLEHAEDFVLVHSVNFGISQHDPYSWEVVRDGFVPVEGFTNSSQFVDDTLRTWIAGMDPALREKMIDGMFSVFSASDSRMLRDLWSGKKTLTMLKAFGDLDEETKGAILEAFRILRNSAKKTLPRFLARSFGFQGRTRELPDA